MMSDFDAVPINAGRTSGSVGTGEGDVDGDPGVGVCAEVRSALSNKPTKQKIRSRMAK